MLICTIMILCLLNLSAKAQNCTSLTTLIDGTPITINGVQVTEDISGVTPPGAIVSNEFVGSSIGACGITTSTDNATGVWSAFSGYVINFDQPVTNVELAVLYGGITHNEDVVANTNSGTPTVSLVCNTGPAQAISPNIMSVGSNTSAFLGHGIFSISLASGFTQLQLSATNMDNGVFMSMCSVQPVNSCTTISNTSATPSPESCDGNNDGSISFSWTASGGVPDDDVESRLQISNGAGGWNTVSGYDWAVRTSPVNFTNLASDTYRISYREASTNCSSPTIVNMADVVVGSVTVDAGTFTSPSGCINHASPVSVTHNNDHATSNTQEYAITNEFGYILSIQTTPDFGTMPTGDYSVYAVNYDTGGVDNFNVGTDINLLTGSCFTTSSVAVSICPKQICGGYSSMQKQ